MLKLNQSRPDIWICSINDPLISKFKHQYINLLTSLEREKVFRYRFDNDQLLSLVSRIFLRYVLCQYTTRRFSEFDFISGDKGKLFLKDNIEDLQFNLSHTKGMILIGITRSNPIGVDIEFIKRSNDIQKISKHYFSDVEVCNLNQLPPDQRINRFYDLWTLKESYIKAWGLGLSIPLADFGFVIQPKRQDDSIHSNTNITLHLFNQRKDASSDWHHYLFNINPNYRAALSIHKAHRLNDGNSTNLNIYQCIPLHSFELCTLPIMTDL